MKTIYNIFICFLAFITTNAPAGISGSGHDFSAQGWANGEICLPCHTPHKADMTILNAPLWNHEISTATYTTYDSPTMDVVVGEPLGISKLCLSCHDGTVALENFGGNQTGTDYVTGDSEIGTDLSDDHPISILWTHQTVGGIGGDPWANCTICHDNIGENPEKYPVPFYTYDGGGQAGTYYLECSSCHDPHNGHTGPDEPMLRMSNANSALCLYCH